MQVNTQIQQKERSATGSEMRVCVHGSMYVCMCASVCAWMLACVRMLVCMRVCAYVRMCVCACLCACRCACTCVRVCMYMRERDFYKLSTKVVYKIATRASVTLLQVHVAQRLVERDGGFWGIWSKKGSDWLPHQWSQPTWKGCETSGIRRENERTEKPNHQSGGRLGGI